MQCLTVILAGVMSFASPGVLEGVAVNRAAGITAYSVPQNWQQYDTLLAVESCQYVGLSGILSVDGVGKRRALVVDCQAVEHKKRASLTSLGLLADTNRYMLVHHKARLSINYFCYRRALLQ